MGSIAFADGAARDAVHAYLTRFGAKPDRLKISRLPFDHERAQGFYAGVADVIARVRAYDRQLAGATAAFEAAAASGFAEPTERERAFAEARSVREAQAAFPGGNPELARDVLKKLVVRAGGRPRYRRDEPGRPPLACGWSAKVVRSRFAVEPTPKRLPSGA